MQIIEEGYNTLGVTTVPTVAALTTRPRKDLRLRPPCLKGANEETLTFEDFSPSNEGNKFLADTDDAVNWVVAITESNPNFFNPNKKKFRLISTSIIHII